MKNLKQTISLFVLLNVFPLLTFAQTDLIVRDHLSKDDYTGLVDYYNNHSEARSEIEDAFDYFVDWQTMTYERVHDLNLHCTSEGNTPLKALFQRVLKQKEIAVVKEVAELTAEQMCIYLANYPKRVKIVETYFNNALNYSLDSLTYEELLYVQTNFHENKEVDRQMKQRHIEGAIHIKNAVETYCKLEASYTDRLLFILKYRAWQYLVSRHKTAVNYYSKVGIVDDHAKSIVNQYNGIIHSCFSADDLNKQLSKDISAYVTAINNARTHFAAMAELPDDFPKAEIKLPSIGNFPIRSNMDIANRIPAARKDFVSSRKTAGTIASVASWFIGGIASAIGKGLYDIYAVDDLAETEYNTRRDYIADVCNQLQSIFQDYYNTLDTSILKQISDNQNSFRNYVKQH